MVGFIERVFPIRIHIDSEAEKSFRLGKSLSNSIQFPTYTRVDILTKVIVRSRHSGRAFFI